LLVAIVLFLSFAMLLVFGLSTKREIGILPFVELELVPDMDNES